MTTIRKFSPVRSDDTLNYVIVDDKVTVTHTDANTLVSTVDNFDFSGFPDGEADIESIQTILPINPFVSAKRVEGFLELILISFHGSEASESERFPKWEVIGNE